MGIVGFGALWLFAVGSAVATPENTSPACRDQMDNDGDGHIDCDDQDCRDFTFCAEASDEPDEPEIAHDNGRWLLRAGLTVHWLTGPTFGFERTRGARGHYFTVASGFSGGTSTDDLFERVMFETGVLVGYRGMYRVSPVVVMTASVMSGLHYMMEFDLAYEEFYYYTVPHGRLATGVMFGAAGQRLHGVELAFMGGGVQHLNAEINPWEEDYSGIWLGGAIEYVTWF